jgi:hypothetical protein
MSAADVSEWAFEQDPIRIVPLHPVAPAGGEPQLVYNGGPLLTSVEVFTIYWGSWWESPDGTSLSGDLNGFFDYVLTSPLIDQLGEYSTAGRTIGHGRRTGTTTLTTPDPGATVSDAAIQMLLAQLISVGTVPAADANSLFFVYLPPDVAVTQGGAQSCRQFCGYHNATNDGVYYAVMPYPGCTGCEGGLALFDALTSTSSHELCEAITDPVPGQGWYDEANGEIGDICAWETRQVGGYTVQLEWSNSAGRCM